MKIVVCVKQVPDTADIQWTEYNTIDRANVESIINPYDELALETALSIQDKNPKTEITVVSMGPQQAETMLQYTIALGCNSAVLLSDGKFAGADTIATSRTLAAGIKTTSPDFDLVICGQIAVDGDTAQTGVGLAQNLDIPHITYVTKIIEITKNSVIVEKETDYGIETLEVQFPALICIASLKKKLRKPLIDGFIRAQNSTIKILKSADIGLEDTLVGLKGSPTLVSKAFRPKNTRQNKKVQFNSPEEYALFLNKKVNKL